ncbi:hypothetical protein SAMD00019534_104400, partial [Acytostelium subglobosum LB1]|uniref:hypothetical protein n=1 Tax=Acytostelium subglobosum LB1 TaxID=1410327 RepID=UPI0006449D41
RRNITNVNNNDNNNNGNSNSIDMNSTCGFCRPEMMNRLPINNTIEEYGRHYFICCSDTPSHLWPSKLNMLSPGMSSLYDVIKRHERQQLRPSLFTGIDTSHSNMDNFDILVFPEMIKLRNINAASMEHVLTYFANNNTLDTQSFPSNIDYEPINGRYIYVCTHGQRDARCGFCGPILVDAIKKEIKSRGVNDVKVFGISHVGGHKYAGNVLLFPHGHWYGYVTPDDVPAIVDSALSGDVITRLHRGTMGQPIIKSQ